jgi:nicotinate-nucleotide--dimethylbenzimidazole phosphoribosyltransferase
MGRTAHHRKVAAGTTNMTLRPAMTRAQSIEAIQVGLDTVDAEYARGLDVICLGEMGHRRDHSCVCDRGGL